MRRTRISKTNVKIMSVTNSAMTFYVPKSQNVTVKHKTVYDLFKN